MRKQQSGRLWATACRKCCVVENVGLAMLYSLAASYRMPSPSPCRRGPCNHFRQDADWHQLFAVSA